MLGSYFPQIGQGTTPINVIFFARHNYQYHHFPYFYCIALISGRGMQWQPTLVLALGKSHGQSHLIGCCPCVPRESTGLSDFIFTFSVSCTGKEMSTHSSILSWRIQRMKAPGRLPSMWLHRVRHD